MAKQALERLRAARASLQSQYEALGNQIKGLDRAIALCEGADADSEADPAPAQQPRRGRMPIKDLVLGILTEHEVKGLSAAQVVETAGSRGVALDRASVSSLLSRLKKDGVLTLDGNLYRPARASGAAVLAVHTKQVA